MVSILRKKLSKMSMTAEQFALFCNMPAADLTDFLNGDRVLTGHMKALLCLLGQGVAKRNAAFSFLEEHGDWRDIPAHHGYQANAFGEIRRYKANGKHIHLKHNQRDDGYFRVSIYFDGERRHRTVHRLVCLAFNGEPTGDANMALHKDGNKMNNHADNLYWGTAADNYRDAVIHGTAFIPTKVELTAEEEAAWFEMKRSSDPKHISQNERKLIGRTLSRQYRQELTDKGITLKKLPETNKRKYNYTKESIG